MRVPFEPNILRLRQRKKVTAEGAKGAKEKARSIQALSCEPRKAHLKRRSVLRLYAIVRAIYGAGAGSVASASVSVATGAALDLFLGGGSGAGGSLAGS